MSTIRFNISQIKYDQSFKQNAVALVEAGTPASWVARDLGISTYLVSIWRKEYGTKSSTRFLKISNIRGQV